MSRHERLVAHQLNSQGIITFLPSIVEIHRWSDRRKKVELPLFPGYVFLRANLSPQLRRSVLFARGTAGFISMQGEPVAIPDEQIDSIQKLLSSNVQVLSHPYLKVGQRVRIRGGSLDGIEGILVRCNGESGLVISIDGISRSLSLRIEGYDVESA
jgi:transcription antitermination factor NusG